MRKVLLDDSSSSSSSSTLEGMIVGATGDGKIICVESICEFRLSKLKSSPRRFVCEPRLELNCCCFCCCCVSDENDVSKIESLLLVSSSPKSKRFPTFV